MSLSKKILSRIITYTLIAGLAVPYTVSCNPHVDNSSVYAVESSASEEFITNPLASTRCSLYTDGSKSFNINGRTYYQGIIMGDGSYNDGATISYNVEKIKNISFSLGHIDNTNSNSSEFSIYLDGVLEDKFTLVQGELIKDYSIDVSSASKLTITRTGNYSQYAIANVYVDNAAPIKSFDIPQYKTSSGFISSGYDNFRTKIYDGIDSTSCFKIKGRSYYQGIIMGDGSYNENSAISFNVENINTISFTLGHVDNSASSSCEFSIYLDNVLEDKFTLNQNELTKEYTLDVSKASTLRIFRNGQYSQYAIADVKADQLAPKTQSSIPEYKTSSTFVNSIFDNYRTTVYDGSSSSVFFNMNGRSYYQGVVMGDGSYNENSAFSLNVENLNNISFTLGHVDGSNASSTELSIYLDYELKDKITLSRSNPLMEYNIDVSKAKTLRIFRNGEYSKYGVANIKTDKLTTKNTYSVPEYKNSALLINSIFDNYRTVSYDGMNSSTYFKMNGRKYCQGVVLGDNSGAYNEGAAFSLNVENLKTISFDLGHVDNSNLDNASLSIYLDGEEVDKLKLVHGKLIEGYTIDVSKASTLRIYRDGYISSQYAIGDIKADEISPKNIHTVPKYENAEKFLDNGFNIIRSTIYSSLNTSESFKMNGTEYTKGLTIGDDTYNDNSYVAFNVENLDSLSFMVGHVDGKRTTAATLTVYCDNKAVEKITLTGDMIPTKHTINVSGTSNITFYKDGDMGTYGISNFEIKTSSANNTPVPDVTSTSVTTAAPAVTSTSASVSTAASSITSTSASVSTAASSITSTSASVSTAAPAVTSTSASVSTAAPAVTLTSASVSTAAPAVTSTSVSVSSAAPSITSTSASVSSAAPAVTSTSPSVTTTAPKKPMKGDMNNDSKLTTSDVRIILQFIVGSYTLSKEQMNLADIDNNGNITSTDALRLLRYIIGASDIL